MLSLRRSTRSSDRMRIETESLYENQIMLQSSIRSSDRMRIETNPDSALLHSFRRIPHARGGEPLGDGVKLGNYVYIPHARGGEP